MLNLSQNFNLWKVSPSFMKQRQLKIFKNSKNVSEAYKLHESRKKLKYEFRIINVEKRTFKPLVFACAGGAGLSVTKVNTRLAAKNQRKRIRKLR